MAFSCKRQLALHIVPLSFMVSYWGSVECSSDTASSPLVTTAHMRKDYTSHCRYNQQSQWQLKVLSCILPLIFPEVNRITLEVALVKNVLFQYPSSFCALFFLFFMFWLFAKILLNVDFKWTKCKMPVKIKTEDIKHDLLLLCLILKWP